MNSVIPRKLLAVLDRLGSNHDGERAAAGLIAHRMASGLGGWGALLSPPAEYGRSPIKPMDPVAAHQRRARVMLTRTDLLSQWEQGFVRSVSTQRTLSPAQRDKLNAIYLAQREKDGARA